MSTTRPPCQELAHTESASLDQLMALHPAVWRSVGVGLVEAAKGGPDKIEKFVQQIAGEAVAWHQKLARSHLNPEVLALALPKIAAGRMAKLAAQRVLISAATGKRQGTIRFGLWTGWLVQKLLFDRGLERKPASLPLFRCLWPLATERRMLMPLVQPQGIWCFYTRQLVREIAQLARGRPTLEIGAGDGTLSRFLTRAGVTIRATDNQSWPRPGGYPDDVERLGAQAAIARYRPAVVICSFPPPGNNFERQVFAAPSVEHYLVIASRHRFAAGDWQAYEKAGNFSGGVDQRLSAMVLPPEIDPAVLVFERRSKKEEPASA